MTNDELIAEVRRLDKAATPGPWTEDHRAGRPKRGINAGPYDVADVDSAPSSYYSKFAEAGPIWERQVANANLIASYRTLAPDLATALEQAQARIAELEAAVAALAKAAADDYLHQRLGHGPNDVGVAAQRLDDVLANLPAAVQRHLARDRAAGEMDREIRRWWPEMNDHIRSAEAAYRAAGGEGV